MTIASRGREWAESLTLRAFEKALRESCALTGDDQCEVRIRCVRGIWRVSLGDHETSGETVGHAVARMRRRLEMKAAEAHAENEELDREFEQTTEGT